MEELRDRIKKNRSNLSDSSIKTYVSILKNLFYKAHDKTDKINPDWFDNEKEVLNLLKDKTPETRKTQLACLIVFVGDKEKTKKYEEQMLKDNNETKNKIVKQEKTDKQKENWIDYEELKLIFDKMRDNVKPEELLKKRNIKGKDQQDLQNFILFGLCSGLLGISPRRSLDYTELVVSDDPQDSSKNYMTKKSFIFQNYKTSKKSGTQEVILPSYAKSLMAKYKKCLNPSQEYMFVDNNGHKLDSVKLNQRFNKMTGKHFSVSLFRHAYLSSLYKDVPKLTDMMKNAQNMGHSLEEALLYVKK